MSVGPEVVYPDFVNGIEINNLNHVGNLKDVFNINYCIPKIYVDKYVIQ